MISGNRARPRNVDLAITGASGVVTHVQEARHVLGVFLLLLEDVDHQLPARGVVVAEPANNLAVGLDRDSLGYEILADHLLERRPLLVLGVSADREASGIKIRVPAGMDDSS